MEVQGKVIKTEQGFAFVEIIRKSSCESCEGCQNKDLCHSGMFSNDIKSLVVKAQNAHAAKAGDSVKIKTYNENKFNAFSALIFIVPILLMFVTYIACEFFKMQKAITALLSFLTFALAFMIFAKILDKYCKNHISYTIQQIITNNEK